MNKTRKLASLLLALVMVLGMVGSAMAGSITIKKAPNVSLDGKTFNAYKILDLEMFGDAGYVYTVPAELKNFYATEFSISADVGDFDYQVTQEIAAMQSNSTQLFAFVARALAAAKEAGITPATATGTAAESVKIDNLPLGYYVIEDVGAATPISALMLDSTGEQMEVTLKADKPTIEKKIDGDNDEDEGTNGLVDNNTGAIGDKVPYVLTSKVPDMTGYVKYFYVVTDTLSKGLTFNDDVVITIGDKTLVKDTDYSLTATKNEDGTTSLEIVFKNFIQYQAQKDAAIKITYSATINEQAVIGSAGNPNKVQLEYSSNPNIEPSSGDKPGEGDPTGKTPEDITRTFVTEVKLNKVDPAGNKLAGAEFEITGTTLNKVLVTKQAYVEDAAGTYYMLKNGTYTTEEPTESNSDAYVSTETKYALKTTTEVVAVVPETVKAKATTGPDGQIVFTGLSAGTYTITELKAPEGYNLLQKPIQVVIGWKAPESDTTDCTWSYDWTDAAGEGNTVTVVNKAGTVLPSTGGIGTTLFYIAGSILVVGALVLMITKRRVTEK